MIYLTGITKLNCVVHIKKRFRVLHIPFKSERELKKLCQKIQNRMNKELYANKELTKYQIAAKQIMVNFMYGENKNMQKINEL